jgi:phosphoribosylformylglycinamidine synthase PurS subunit
LHLVRITVTLRKSILDPQGKAVEHAISMLGYKDVTDVRMGKLIEFKVNSLNEEDAKRTADELCKKLLANPVMEDYKFTIESG